MRVERVRCAGVARRCGGGLCDGACGRGGSCGRVWTSGLLGDEGGELGVEGGFGDGVGFEAEELAVDAAGGIEPSAVEGFLAGGEGVSGPGEGAGVEEAGGDELVVSVELGAEGDELIFEGLGEGPAGGVPVDDADEGEGSSPGGAAKLGEEVLGAEEAGGAAEGHDGDAELLMLANQPAKEACLLGVEHRARRCGAESAVLPVVVHQIELGVGDQLSVADQFDKDVKHLLVGVASSGEAAWDARVHGFDEAVVERAQVSVDAILLAAPYGRGDLEDEGT